MAGVHPAAFLLEITEKYLTEFWRSIYGWYSEFSFQLFLQTELFYVFLISYTNQPVNKKKKLLPAVKDLCTHICVPSVEVSFVSQSVVKD